MLAAILLAAAAVAWRGFATLRTLEDAALQRQARVVARRIVPGPDGRPAITSPEQLRRDFGSLDSGSAYLVYDPANTVLLASDPAAERAIGPYLPQGRAGMFRVPASAAYPSGFLGAVVRAGPWRVAVAQQHEQDEALIASLAEAFLPTALGLLLPLMIVTVAIGVFTIRSGLRPLRVVSDAARLVGPGAPGRRLPRDGLPNELVPLVAAVDDALDRLEHALDAQRRFTGEAAHALRTPLAVLAARIDSLGAQPALLALRDDADRLSRLVAQMLALSRVDDLPPDTWGQFDLHLKAKDVVAGLAPLAAQQGVALGLSGGEPQMIAHGDAAAVALALQNIVDNAIRYAPPGSEVEVELVEPATVRVLDRGPGVPAAARAAIFERFHTDRPGGAGLGLAIVASVAQSCGGSAWVEPRPGGGSVFVMALAGKRRSLAPGDHRP